MANWYLAVVVQEIEIDGPRGGVKIKKIRDEMLVEGHSVTEVENVVEKLYFGNPNDHEITKVQLSKIAEVLPLSTINVT